MNFIRRLFILVGNYLPAPVNKVFYKLSGVNFNFQKVWIGSNCFFDTKFPNLITIEDNVCISFKVIIITHFDPSNSIPNHPIKPSSKPVIIKSGSFIGPGAIIYPGVIVENNSFVKAGSIVKDSTLKNSIIVGNPGIKVGVIKKSS
jgi:acetyltransferase-like isoleucine patch superfamily enzyme